MKCVTTYTMDSCKFVFLHTCATDAFMCVYVCMYVKAYICILQMEQVNKCTHTHTQTYTYIYIYIYIY